MKSKKIRKQKSLEGKRDDQKSINNKNIENEGSISAESSESMTSLPSHRTAQVYRHLALKDMQKRYGNAYVQEYLKQRSVGNAIGSNFSRELNSDNRRSTPAAQRKSVRELRNARMRPYRPTSLPGSIQRKTPDIQRNGDGGAAAPAKATTLELSSVRLWHILEYPIMITNPSGMNMSAVSLLNRLAEAGKQSSDLRSEIGFLQYAEERGSGEGGELAEVQGARGAIGRAASGRRGEYMQNKVSDYVDSAGEIREKLPAVKAAQTGIKTAAAQLKSVVAAGKAKKAEREKGKAEADIAALKAKVARSKEICKGLFGPVTDLLQGKWSDAGINLAKFIGTEIISAGVDMAYADELRQAKADLEQAKKDLEKFEDEKQAADLEAAVNNLKQAKFEAESAQNALMRVVMKAERAHMNLVEALEKMGLHGAAGALDMRANVMEVSARASKMIEDYDQLAQKIAKHSKGLKNINQMLVEFMLSPGGESTVKNVMHRMQMMNHAKMNAEELDRVEKWVLGEIETIGKVRGYIEGKSYLAPYDAMPATLNEAIATR